MERTAAVNGKSGLHAGALPVRSEGLMRKREGASPERISWYEEPTPISAEQGQPQEYHRWLQVLGEWIKTERSLLFPKWWEMRLRYLEAGQATHQYDLLRDELERNRLCFNEKRSPQREAKLKLRTELVAERNVLETRRRELGEQFAAVAGRIGLSIGTDPGPAAFEQAARAAAPTIQQCAGRDGLTPVEPPGRPLLLLKKVGDVAFGMVVGGISWVLAAVQFGLTSVADLQERGISAGPAVVGAIVLGGTLTVLSGKALASAVLTFRLRSETGSVPAGERWRCIAVAAAGVGYALVTTVLDAHSFRYLQAQALSDLNPLDPALVPGLAPMWAHYLMGSILACSYIGYRCADAWGETHTTPRAAALEFGQWKWLHELRSTPDYREALGLAQQTAFVREDIATLDRQLKQLDREIEALHRSGFTPDEQRRLDEALNAAIGECRLTFQPAVTRLLRSIAQADGGWGGVLSWDPRWNRLALSTLGLCASVTAWAYDPIWGTVLVIALALVWLFDHSQRQAVRKPRRGRSAEG